MTDSKSGFITIAIHTYEKAVELRSMLESEGIDVSLQNISLEDSAVPVGIKVLIRLSDLPIALRIIENREIFVTSGFTPETNSFNYILVPVDFSDCTLNAVRTAAKIAARHKATMTLINSYIDPYVGESLQITEALSYDSVEAEMRQSLSINAKKSMDRLAETIRSEMKTGALPAVKFSTEVVEGVPEDAIISYAKSRQPLLTVMGTRGADKKEKDMVGSVTAEVLDSCLFPVVTLPESLGIDHDGKLRQTLFFCNNDHDDIFAMDNMTRLFPDAGGAVTLAVMPSRRRWYGRQQNDSTAIADYFRNNYPNFKFECVNVSVSQALDTITALHASHKFDMIVVPNKKKINILNRMFNPSLAHKLIFKADIPMLVVPV